MKSGKKKREREKEKKEGKGREREREIEGERGREREREGGEERVGRGSSRDSLLFLCRFHRGGDGGFAVIAF